MENIFKRSMIGMSVASVLATVNVNAMQLNDNIQLYGQAAVSAWYVTQDGTAFARDKDGALTGKTTQNKDSVDIENESRIGLRGTQQFTNFGPTIIWQIESGNVGDAGETGQLGFRDSFLGMEFAHGKFRFGRLTTPAYDIVDWPYTNPGLGNVFDWNTDIRAGAHVDRIGNHFRWDSKNYNGFTYAVSAGQAEGNVDSAFYSVAAHYTKGIVTLHAGYQFEGEKSVALTATEVAELGGGVEGVTADRSFYVLGGELNFANGFALKAAYKHMNSDYDAASAPASLKGYSEKQDAYSVTAEYNINSWQYKIGYAATTDLDTSDGKVSDTADTAITGRIMYLLDPSAVIYTDVRSYNFGSGDVDNSQGAKDQTKFGIGVEYYF
ncbi:MAG: porin [Enterovibrio sp.]